MPSITPSLWSDHNLEEAATFYTSVFGELADRGCQPGYRRGAR